MKKIFAILLCLTLVLSFAACGQKAEEEPTVEEQPSAGIVNPLVEVSVEDLNKQLGLGFVAPELAEDVQCFVLADEIAQMVFTIDGQEFCLRAKPSDLLELDDESADLSGLFYEFEAVETDVADRPAKLYVNEDEGVGYIAWLDVAPGVLYNLAMEENASADVLSFVAETVFTSVQGNN